MMLTCRIVFFLAFTGWILSSCERHELSETKVLYHGHGDHGHGDKSHDDKGHRDKGHHPETTPAGHHDSKKVEVPQAGKQDVKPPVTPAKEEPRNIGI